jgi:hypothetical protein
MSAITANIGAEPRTVAIVVFDGVAMFEFAAAHEVSNDTSPTRRTGLGTDCWSVDSSTMCVGTLVSLTG